MKVLITGSSGFLGSNLSRKFKQSNHEVYSLRFGDFRGTFKEKIYEYCLQNKPDLVILAGANQSAKDDISAIEDLTFSNILVPSFACRGLIDAGAKAKLIHIGSSWEHDEDGVSNPFNFYASTKLACSNILSHFAQHGLDITHVKLYDTYGENDARQKILNIIIESILNKQTLKMSGARQEIDLVHIDDVVNAIHSLGVSEHSPGFSCYSVCTEKPIILRDLVRLVIDKVGEVSSDIEFGHFPYRPRERFKMYYREPLPPGWQPEIPLEVGIERLLRSYNAKD